MRGGSCAASGTSATEHPFNLFLSRTGVWGYPPDKRLSEANQQHLLSWWDCCTRENQLHAAYLLRNFGINSLFFSRNKCSMFCLKKMRG
jgi:hypothetical protein